MTTDKKLNQFHDFTDVSINPPRTDAYAVILEGQSLNETSVATYSEVDGWEINGVIAWAEMEDEKSVEAPEVSELKMIPVTERMPDELVPVLVYSPKQTERKTKFDVSWRYNGRWTSWWLSGITHWCPLPAEPVDYSMFENPLCDYHDYPMKKVDGEHVCEICEWEEKESFAKRW